jgi:CHAT domain-containing protein
MMDALIRHDAKFENLLAFGDPDGSLKGALEEVKAIAKIVPNTEVLTLGEATESRVKTRPDSFSVLHLATHAILNNANPKSSYIVFAPDTARGEDGKLGFGEILRIPLKNKTILVTLSACQTAVGKNPTGSEVINLARAFTSAGVPSILSTLWPVEDLSTRNLMISFYQNLIRENKVESLRDAQLELLRSSATAHPFFWAPFILIGDWQ